MKSIILNSLCFFSIFFSFGQTVEKSSIDSGGASSTGSSLEVLYSIGEVAVNEVNTGSLIISEGFIGPFQNCDINSIEAPDELILVYDGLGNTSEVNQWLEDFETLVNTSPCGNFAINYTVISTFLEDPNFDDIQDRLIVQVEFEISDNLGNFNYISSSIIFNEFAGAGFFNGNGDAICENTFDLNNIDTGVDYTDPKYNSSTFNISQSTGVPGASQEGSGTTVRFPDTGAGQFTYIFDVEVSTSISIGTESISVESTTQCTANFVTVAFDPGPNITVTRCDFSNIDLIGLYEELEIQIDVDTSPFNEADLNGNIFDPASLWYNETDDLEANPNTPPLTEITAPGTYQFNAKAFLADCAGEPVFVTIVESCDILVDGKVKLQGFAANSAPGEEFLMGDDLRVNGLIPTLSPYIDALSCDPSVFTISGPDAIVDWVWVELREDFNISNVISETSALLQRDGDIVAVDGISPLNFDVPEADYYISVSHRNHLGVLSAQTLTLTLGNTSFFNFTLFIDDVDGGNNAIATLPDGTLALYSGDFNGDGQVQNTDRLEVEILRGINGYDNADIDG
ncbi:hypothetical protein, partial [Winogradskyella aquimaris]